MKQPVGGEARGPTGNDSRRRWLAIAIAAIVALSLTGVGVLLRGGRTHDATVTPVPTGRAHPPNVLVFVTDDQDFGTWSAMPRTRRLVLDHGIEFTNAYVSNPSCCPSRATILTGDWSHTTGVYTNHGYGGGTRAFYRMGNEQRTIATYLDPSYDTALFGKYLNGYAAEADRIGQHAYVPPGWDEWQAFYGMNGSYYHYRLNVDGRLERYGGGPKDYSTDVLGERLRDWLDPSDGVGRDPTQPFFAYFAAFSPHGPSEASPTYGDDHRFLDLPAYDSPAVNERDVSDKPTYIRGLQPLRPAGRRRLTYQWRLQHQSLFSYDRQIGLTLRLLRREHQLHDTLVIVMSDNGEEDGEHRWKYKLVPYERSIHVPLAIRYDRLIRHKGVVDDTDMVANTDLLPTITALALGRGWRPPAPVDGVSLRAILMGKQRGPLRRSMLLENGYYNRGDKQAVPTYCGLLTLRWKYVVYSPTPRDPGLVVPPEEDELYNLRDDPYELRNVVTSRPDVAARLRERLATACSPTPPGWSVAW